MMSFWACLGAIFLVALPFSCCLPISAEILGQNVELGAPLYTGGPSVYVGSQFKVSVTLEKGDESSVIIIVDGNHVFEATNSDCKSTLVNRECLIDVSDMLSKGIHTIVVYSKDHEMYTLVEPFPVTLNNTGMPQENSSERKHVGLTHQVGIYYTTLNQPSAHVTQMVSKYLGHPAYTVEDVLRSGGKLNLADVLEKWSTKIDFGWPLKELNWYQDRPDLGYYCLYRKRPGEKGIIPDCVNITETLEKHASELTSAGIDYIVFDATNSDQWPSDESDVRTLRPTEVVFEEWKKLRDRGIKTPQLAVWNQIFNGGTLWKQYLSRIYNNPDYEDMIWRDPKTGKKVFMIVWRELNNINYTAVDEIAKNGGKNDIVILKAWEATSYDPQWFKSGLWTYLSPCVAKYDDFLNFTTSVHPDVPCNHLKTENSPLGSSWTASMQTAICNIPFASPGKLNGLWFKKQMEDVFNSPADQLFMPSWNEFEIRPMSMKGWLLNNTHFHGMGVEGDANEYSFFLDGYGSERSRTVEPSVTDKGKYYQLMASCLRVARLGVKTCNVKGEPCCEFGPDNYFASISSLERVDGTDTLLTNNEQEKTHLLLNKAWIERCNPFTGPTDFCANQSMPWHPWDNYNVVRGPFMTYANTTSSIEHTLALYRCVRSSGKHLFSLHLDCEGYGTLEYALGYISEIKSSLFPRTLYRCYNAKRDEFYHAADESCRQGDELDGSLGFVM